MPCYHPLSAFQSLNADRYGKKTVAFRPIPDSRPLQLPCGRCIGCRLERSRQWAVRLVHENKLHERSCFLTLTYDQDHVPKDGSLNVKHFQDFMKRLRKWQATELPEDGKLRFFHCGEYGEKNGRPHYHAIIFGQDFVHDRVLHSKNHEGDGLYVSRDLGRLWPMGLHTIGAVTFESCAYVARYITKKVTGDAAAAYYETVDPRTGEVFSLRPEYVTMSRRPGIGRGFYDRFSSDIYPSDKVITRGKAGKPPRAYDRYLEAQRPEAYERMKESREFRAIERAREQPGENSPARLADKESVQLAQFKQLKRSYENG